MRKNIIRIFILAFLTMGPGPALCEVVDKIAVIVNNEVITEGEINRTLGPIYEQYKTLYKASDLIKKLEEARQKIITQFIEDMLILGEAKRLNIPVDDKELEAKIEETRRRFASRAEFDKALAEQHLTVKSLKERYRDQAMTRRMIDEKFGMRVTITPVEINNYYDSHIKEFIQPEELKLRNILISPKEDLPPQKALGLANEILKRLKEGGDFGGLAKVYSTGPNAEGGGMMGFVRQGDLLPEIEKEVFQLQEGEVSGIIQTGLGYHIFKVEEKRESRSLPLSEVRRDVEDRIFREKIKEKVKEWLEALKKNAYIAFK